MAFGAVKTFLTSEKRYNFGVDELDIVANGYEHFRSVFIQKDQVTEFEGRLKISRFSMVWTGSLRAGLF